MAAKETIGINLTQRLPHAPRQIKSLAPAGQELVLLREAVRDMFG
jgi:hypothetical protein